MKLKLKPLRTIRSQQLSTGKVLIIAIWRETTKDIPGYGSTIGVIRDVIGNGAASGSARITSFTW